MRVTGEVLWYECSKGIGLISTGKIPRIVEVFLHDTSLKDAAVRAAAAENKLPGSLVSFETEPGATKGLRALDVLLA